MRQASQIFKINTYYSGKLKQAEKIKDKLMDNIHGMTHLRYDKGTRDGDYALREKLKDLMQETEKYYKMIRAFGGGKIGDTDVFREILTFYGGQYLDSFPLVNCLDRLKFEIVNQENRDREHNIKKAGRKYVRRKNLYAKNFERDLNEWEMILLQKTVPLFAAFINELNDLVLFVRINSILDSLIIGDNTFALRGDVFGDFKIYIAMFIGYYIKNRKIYLSDREIRELICRTLDDMGFMDIILNTKNIRQEKFNELVDQINSEYGFKDLAKKFQRSGAETEKAEAGLKKKDSITSKELLSIMETLCYMDQTIKPGRGNKQGYVTGLADKPGEQYLFFSPGTFDISLKYVAEYLRDALIFIMDWLGKELQKDPEISEVLEPILQCVADVNNFILAYKMTLEVASIKSNQAESKVLLKERHYVSRDIAGELIQTILVTSANIHEALIAASYHAGTTSFLRRVFSKKIKIIQDSFDNTYVKIKRGLAKIEKT